MNLIPLMTGGYRAMLAISLVAASQAAFAGYPDKPIRWIVPAAAGGAADSTVRIVATELAKRLGQPLIIDNKPGAAGVIGLDAVAKAPPDGYTIGTNNLSAFVVASILAKKLPYDPAQDFAPIAQLTTQPNLLAVNTSLPVHSVKELVAYSKANPDKPLFYGSPGNGSAIHVVTELFATSAGVVMAHAPYKSTPAAQMDLASGQIQILMDNLSTAVPNVKAGRSRALAVTGAKRSHLLPNVPTMAEAGVPAAEMTTWGGVVGPAKLPQEIVNKLNAEINAVLADPRVIKKLEETGSDAAPMSPRQFGDRIKADFVRWSAVIKKANIKLD